jgi:putative nucleotidyltransferase with HDIG domain
MTDNQGVGTRGLQELRVLLIDPHSLVLRFMAFAFTSNGCVAATASTAEDTLQLLATPGQPFDLVVADVELPGLGGAELLRAVKAKQPGAPVVLTGAATAEPLLVGLRNQAYDHLKKPFTVEEVQRLIQRVQDDRLRRSAPPSPPEEPARPRTAGPVPGGVADPALADIQALSLDKALDQVQQLLRRLQEDRRQPVPETRHAQPDPAGRPPVGIEALFRIGDIALQGFDIGTFMEQALGQTVRGLTGDAGVALLHDQDGNPTATQFGDRALASELLTTVNGTGEELYRTADSEAAILNGNARGFAAVVTVIPGTEKPMGLLCVGRKAGTAFLADEKALLPGYARTIAVALQKVLLGESLESNVIDTISSFVIALEAKDLYLKGHSARVSLYAGEIAKAMSLSANQVAMARRAGVLHDLGKLVINDSVYRQPGALTYEGSALMRAHPMTGARILRPLRFLAQEAEVIKAHHERYDGQGYPDGLKGDKIPLAARVIAVADAFDAMTSNRPYRSAMSIDTAVAEVLRLAGTQFDPAVTQAFGQIPVARLAEIARFYDSRPESAATSPRPGAEALVQASKRLTGTGGWPLAHAADGESRRARRNSKIVGISRAPRRRQIDLG